MDVSEDILYIICRLLPIPDLLRLSATCHSLLDFSYTDSLWISPLKKYREKHKLPPAPDGQTARQHLIRLMQNIDFWENKVLYLKEYDPLDAKSVLLHYEKYSNCWELEMYTPKFPQECNLNNGIQAASTYLEFCGTTPHRVINEAVISFWLFKGMRYLPYYRSTIQNDEYTALMYWRLIEDGIVVDY